MKNIIKHFCIGFIAVATLSCEKEPALSGEQTDFLSRTAYGVYAPSEELFVYSESSCQLYYSPTKHSARILKDDLSAHITVTFKNDIAADATVEGSVKLQGINTGSFQEYPLKVLKVEDGKAWVWYDRRNVGYLIPWGI